MTTATMTAARLAETVTALGEGYAPAAAEALDAARTGRLHRIDTGSCGEDGYAIADDAETALSDWLAAVYPDGCEAEGFATWEELVARRRWTATTIVIDDPTDADVAAAQDVEYEMDEAMCREVADATTLRRLHAGDEGAVLDGIAILRRMGWRENMIPAPRAPAELAGWINAELLRERAD